MKTERLCGPIFRIILRSLKIDGTVIREAKENARENFDVIFVSRDQKSKNQGLSCCADLCLLPICEFQNSHPSNKRGEKKMFTDGHGWMDGRTGGRVNRRTDRLTYISTHFIRSFGKTSKNVLELRFRKNE